VRARTQVEVSSEVAGRVAVVAVAIGDVVRKGDLLFSLDGEQLKSAVDQITAALTAAEALVARADVAVREAERALERDRKLAGQGVVTEDAIKLAESRLAGAQAERAQAQANVERARVDLDRSKDALRRARVVAPQAGTVVAVGVEVGRVVTSGTGLSASPDATLGLGLGSQAPVVIADLDELIVKLDVDELDIARVRAGQHAVVRAQGIKDVAFDGVVEKVGLLGRDAMGAVLFAVDVRVTGSRAPAEVETPSSPTTPAGTSSFNGPAALEAPRPPAPASLPSPRELLRPGMTASAEIEVEHVDDAIVVPLAAVLEATKNDDEDKPDRVFVVDDGPAVAVGPGARGGPTDAPPPTGGVPDAGAASEAESATARGDRVVTVREVAVRLGPSEGDAIAVLDAAVAGLLPGVRVVEGPFRELKQLTSGARIRELVEDEGKRGPDGKPLPLKKQRKKKGP
jgi:multidrug efflux pump subunit AcrA (membrane-fusion protein)